jgi:ribonuclease E
LATSKKTTRKRTKKTASAELEEATETTSTPKRTTKKKVAKKAVKKAAKKTAAKVTKKKAKSTAKRAGKKTTKKAAAESKAETTGITRHEAEDGSIVIRFPPAAPSPFADLHTDEMAAPAQEKSKPEPVTIIDDEPEVIEASEPVVEDTTDSSPARERDEEESGSGRRRRRRGGRGRGRRGRDAQDEAPVSKAPVEEADPDVEAADDDTYDELDTLPDDDDTVTLLSPPDDDDEVLTVVSDDDDDEDDFDPEDFDDNGDSVAEEVEADEDEDESDAEDAPSRKSRGRGRGRRRSRRRGRGEENREDREERDEPEELPEKKPARDKRRGRTRGRRLEDSVPAIDDGPRERRMIINYVPRDECRIAITGDDRLEEIYLERASYENHVGSIYKGVVTNVEPSIQAAFVDFGVGKNGFLHITDLHPDYMASENRVENVGRKMPRRSRPPIQKCLRRGQELIVQITKEGIGTKGPTLSTYVSIPGRFLVMMPGMRKLGISRKIEDDNVRSKIRSVMSELELPDGIGFIARTAAEGRTVDELQSDLNYLERLWKAVTRRIKKEKAPTELYRESDLIVRTIRDVFAEDISEIVVDDPEVADRARDFLSIFSPDSDDIVKLYDGTGPIFHRYKIEDELEKLHSRTVPLKSGGSLVIEATEALVAIDVNSGKFRTEDDAEMTAFKINEEAADEISRQLRLRDLGGVVVCDFIDMREEKHKREIERRLIGRLKQHKERAKVLRMSQFGIIELTRQRQRASLTRNVYQDCSICHGKGLVKTTESVMIDVTRQIQWAVSREHVNQIDVMLAPDVADLIQNRKRSVLHKLEQEHRKTITIRPNGTFTPDQVQLQCFDQRGRQVPME